MAKELTLSELDDRQLLFVTYYVESGDGEGSALKAGYAPSTARIWKSKLISQAHIAWGLAVATRKAIANSAPMALRTLKTLAESAESEKVRAECAKALLDRAGFVAPRATLAPAKDDKPLHEQSTSELQALAARLESELAGRAKHVNSADAAPNEPQDVDIVG